MGTYDTEMAWCTTLIVARSIKINVVGGNHELPQIGFWFTMYPKAGYGLASTNIDERNTERYDKINDL